MYNSVTFCCQEERVFRARNSVSTAQSRLFLYHPHLSEIVGVMSAVDHSQSDTII